MISFKESLKILKETDALLDGHFILSSGLRSPQYIQCAKLLSKPNFANILCQSLALKIEKEFNNILFKDGYRSFLDFKNLKGFTKLIASEVK